MLADNLNRFYSDYDLNTVCHDVCIGETHKCLMICDPTDSECIYECLRAQATCMESKYSDTNVISSTRTAYPFKIRKILWESLVRDMPRNKLEVIKLPIIAIELVKLLKCLRVVPKFKP